MNEMTLLLILAVAFAAAFITALALASRRRTSRLRLAAEHGIEYDVALGELGNSARAAPELSERVRRGEQARFRDANAADRQRFAASWQRIQGRFVDDPAFAVTAAHELINQLMRARGYSNENLQQGIAELSVAHPTVVQHYHAARDLSRSVHDRTIDTEELRQAIIHCRALFADLLPQGNRERAFGASEVGRG